MAKATPTTPNAWLLPKKEHSTAELGVADFASSSVMVLYVYSIWYWPYDSQSSQQIEMSAAYLFELLPFFPFLFALARHPALLSCFGHDVFIRIFLLYAPISILWSTDIFSSVVASTSYFFLVAYCALQSNRIGARNLLLSAYIPQIIILAVSVTGAVIGFDIFLMKGDHDGLWRGLFNHKNLFGAFCTQVLLITVLAGQHLGVRVIYRIAVCVLSVLGMVGSSSATALIVVVVLILVLMLSPPRILERVSWLAAGAIMCGVAFVVWDPLEIVPTILAIIGRDPTLSGRNEVWTLFLYIKDQSPFWGTGYGTAYLPSAYVAHAKEALFMAVQSPHNTYIALGLNLGWPAAFLYAAWLIQTLALGFRSISSSAFGRLLIAASLSSLLMSFVEVVGWAAINRGDFFLLLVCARAVFDDKSCIFSLREAHRTKQVVLCTSKGSGWRAQ